MEHSDRHEHDTDANRQLASSIERLVDNWEDDRARRDLEAVIRENPQLLPSYIDQMSVHNDLVWFSAEYLSDDASPATAEKVRPRRFTLWTTFLALAATALICAAFISWNSFRGPSVVATVVSVADLDAESTLSPGDRIAAGPLLVRQGRVDLLFDSGAMVRCQCPLNMNIESPMRVQLNQGKLTATVGEEASGFSVITDHLGVVDLGTEFGVTAEAGLGTDVFVFSGEVLLEAGKLGSAIKGSLTEGRALHVSSANEFKRLAGVFRDPISGTWVSAKEKAFDQSGSVVVAIGDNLEESHSRGFVELVPGGFKDDTRAFVDRIYEWNGLTADGIPTFLRGADLIRTFNDDKVSNSLRMYVKLRTDACVFVLWDNRCQPLPWLTERFVDTGVDIGLDEGPPAEDFVLGRGAGESIDFTFSVWAVRVRGGEVVEFGPLGNEDIGKYRSMYGIAVAGYDRHHEDALSKIPVRSFAGESHPERLPIKAPVTR